MQKTLIYIDVITKQQIQASGKFITKTADMLTVERGSWQILCIKFVERTVDEYGTVTLTPYSGFGNDSYVLTADNDFDDDNSLMMKSCMSSIPFDSTDPLSNRFNIQGDWIDGSTADMSKGEMSIRINSDTAKFEEVLGAKKTSSNNYINVKQYLPGIATPSTIAWFQFVAINTVRDSASTAPEELDPTGGALIPYVLAFLSSPLIHEFSVNGVDSWHTEQIDDDNYYRYKMSGVNTDWSTAIKLKRGKDGIDGIDGKDGSDGKSAYQIAVDKGFEGNESEWLESLKADGAKSEIADAGNYFDSTTVEGVLQEIGRELDGLETALTEI